MSEPGKPFEEGQDSGGLPPGLRSALRDLHRPRAALPPGFDKAVLAAARGQWARQRRHRLIIRLVPLTAAAAAIGLIVWLGGPWDGPAERGSTTPAAHSLVSRTPLKDINGDGRVDVLDAFMLARQVETGQVTGLRWDFNDDQVVDRRDVDAVALAAVRLDREAVQ